MDTRVAKHFQVLCRRCFADPNEDVLVNPAADYRDIGEVFQSPRPFLTSDIDQNGVHWKRVDGAQLTLVGAGIQAKYPGQLVGIYNGDRSIRQSKGQDIASRFLITTDAVLGKGATNDSPRYGRKSLFQLFECR